MAVTREKNNLRSLKEKHGLTGAQIGILAGVSPRTVRTWLIPEDNPRHITIPRSAWRLLCLLLGEATPEEIIREAEKQAELQKRG
jgi:transcriptional regulator with XRE-family HTH domain